MLDSDNIEGAYKLSPKHNNMLAIKEPTDGCSKLPWNNYNSDIGKISSNDNVEGLRLFCDTALNQTQCRC